jgi:hypothetical protein
MSTLLVSCGYSLKGTGIYLPKNIRALHVPLFKNNNYQLQLEQFLTDAVVQRLERYKDLRVVREQDADAIVRGTILAYGVIPQQVSASGIVEEYRFDMIVNVELYDVVKKENIYETGRFKFSETYPSEGDLETRIELQEEAWEEACRDIAEVLVSGMLEGF